MVPRKVARSAGGIPGEQAESVAGALLAHVCEDVKRRGVDTLYLITDHTSFYERCGWEFFCTV